MKCLICRSNKTKEVSKKTLKRDVVLRKYECDDCFTEFETKERFIRESVPEYLLDQIAMKVGDVMINKKQLKTAEDNGIYRDLLRSRIVAGDSVEEAISRPIKSPNQYGEWLHVARKNKIPQGTFYNRIHKGMSPEDAATKPKSYRTYDMNYLELAKQNGIKRDVFYYRVKAGYTEEQAASMPLKRHNR